MKAEKILYSVEYKRKRYKAEKYEGESNGYNSGSDSSGQHVPFCLFVLPEKFSQPVKKNVKLSKGGKL